jgi:hypothetical protein
MIITLLACVPKLMETHLQGTGCTEPDLVQVNVHLETLFSRRKANLQEHLRPRLAFVLWSLSGKEGETAPLRVGTASSFFMQQNMRCNFHLHTFEHIKYSDFY